ncbi:MAG: protein-L-isoaspartate(D-aspartate) O-methyltransferase [Planctomycetota bacterium]|nr:protein-L-isoaspartate(D-aspartate) O-methyltransferase [Planctomycetota bacterium]
MAYDADELERMVEGDLRDRGISDRRVLDAFRKVDRAAFVPEYLREQAYTDRALQLSHGQTISQPYMVALMLQALKLCGTEKVLEIGTGSGYLTALLAELAREVWTVERIEFLATTAEDRLTDLGYANIRYRLGDGSLGWPEEAPYDRIVVSAACPRIPKALEEQLAESGLLVAPVGSAQEQELLTATRRGGKLETRAGPSCIFVRLIGQNGFSGET